MKRLYTYTLWLWEFVNLLSLASSCNIDSSISFFHTASSSSHPTAINTNYYGNITY